MKDWPLALVRRAVSEKIPPQLLLERTWVDFRPSVRVEMKAGKKTVPQDKKTVDCRSSCGSCCQRGGALLAR